MRPAALRHGARLAATPVASMEPRTPMSPSSNPSSIQPLVQVAELLARAKEAEPDVPEAMALATVDAEGRPAVRIVLLRGLDESGIVFYTNFHSAKATELDANPDAAVCLHFKSLRQQIRIQGSVERVDDATADAYFASRPRGSQLGAWASRQSAPLSSRKELLDRYAALEQQYAGRNVPRPPFWGGYRLRPTRIEIWRHEDSRLHHRELFERDGEHWRMTLLNP